MAYRGQGGWSWLVVGSGTDALRDGHEFVPPIGTEAFFDLV